MTNCCNRVPVVLASGSPRRRQLLAALGLDFCAMVSDVPEAPGCGEQPDELVMRFDAAKAEAVAAERPDALIIAADTVVVVDGGILGKPESDAEACAMLTRLRGRQHLVYTGLAVFEGRGGRRCTQVAITPVTMRAYGQDEMAAYVASGDPRDKAGAYAIQSPSFDPIAHIDGCYANVMGLPLCHLCRVLHAWQVEVPMHPLAACPQALRSGCSWAAGILEATANLT